MQGYYEPVAMGDDTPVRSSTNTAFSEMPSSPDEVGAFHGVRDAALEMTESPMAPPKRLFTKPHVSFAIDECDATEHSDGGSSNININSSNGTRAMSVVSNNSPVPISRSPTKSRDSMYALFFLIHFIIVGMLSFLEGSSVQSRVFDYSNAGSWSSMIMIVVLLGSFVGIAIVAVINLADSRETLLSVGMLMSITLQACLGNILLLLRSSYSFLGVAVLLSALSDSLQYNKAKVGLSFTGALIQTVIEIFKSYGTSLAVACVSIIIAQTFVLLWWGAFFVSLISNVSSASAHYLIFLMALSLYWITNFFHAFMAYMVGGCVLWHFVKSPSESLGPGRRVLLHVHCGLTSSLGSICKFALFGPVSARVLALYLWSSSRRGSLGAWGQVRNAILSVVYPLVRPARKFHRLALCLTATYGRTLCKAADEQMDTHPETVDLSIEDNTRYSLASTATALAGLISITFGVVAERREGASWPLFFLVCFSLAYCGMSLAVQVYSSSIDALIVAFAAQPQRFAIENQIVFLRFVRTTESSLR